MTKEKNPLRNLSKLQLLELLAQQERELQKLRAELAEKEEVPDEDVPLDELPQTGLLQWPIPVMAAAGLALMAIGAASERKQKAEQ